MGMFRRLKEEEHVSFWRITKFGNPLLFYSKNNCNSKRKNRGNKVGKTKPSEMCPCTTVHELVGEIKGKTVYV